MAVEVAPDQRLPATDSSKEGIIPFTEKTAFDLAMSFLVNKDAEARYYHGRDAYRLGEMEVEGQVLIMLGQEHLTIVDPNLPFPIPRMTDLKPITHAGIESLVGSYRVAQEFCVDIEIRKTDGQTPLEQRVKGRRDRLGEILTNLGQGSLVASIDVRSRMRPELVQWQRERDNRSKGQTF